MFQVEILKPNNWLKRSNKHNIELYLCESSVMLTS